MKTAIHPSCSSFEVEISPNDVSLGSMKAFVECGDRVAMGR